MDENINYLRMSYAEAIEVIKSMATELGISMNSTQGQALLTAIDALQIMHDYVTRQI